jgi:hypothetical protein
MLPRLSNRGPCLILSPLTPLFCFLFLQYLVSWTKPREFIDSRKRRVALYIPSFRRNSLKLSCRRLCIGSHIILLCYYLYWLIYTLPRSRIHTGQIRPPISLTTSTIAFCLHSLRPSFTGKEENIIQTLWPISTPRNPSCASSTRITMGCGSSNAARAHDPGHQERPAPRPVARRPGVPHPAAAQATPSSPSSRQAVVAASNLSSAQAEAAQSPSRHGVVAISPLGHGQLRPSSFSSQRGVVAASSPSSAQAGASQSPSRRGILAPSPLAQGLVDASSTSPRRAHVGFSTTPAAPAAAPRTSSLRSVVANSSPPPAQAAATASLARGRSLPNPSSASRFVARGPSSPTGGNRLPVRGGRFRNLPYMTPGCPNYGGILRGRGRCDDSGCHCHEDCTDPYCMICHPMED